MLKIGDVVTIDDSLREMWLRSAAKGDVEPYTVLAVYAAHSRTAWHPQIVAARDANGSIAMISGYWFEGLKGGAA